MAPAFNALWETSVLAEKPRLDLYAQLRQAGYSILEAIRLSDTMAVHRRDFLQALDYASPTQKRWPPWDVIEAGDKWQIVMYLVTHVKPLPET